MLPSGLVLSASDAASMSSTAQDPVPCWKASIARVSRIVWSGAIRGCAPGSDLLNDTAVRNGPDSSRPGSASRVTRATGQHSIGRRAPASQGGEKKFASRCDGTGPWAKIPAVQKRRDRRWFHASNSESGATGVTTLCHTLLNSADFFILIALMQNNCSSLLRLSPAGFFQRMDQASRAALWHLLGKSRRTRTSSG